MHATDHVRRLGTIRRYGSLAVIVLCGVLATGPAGAHEGDDDAAVPTTIAARQHFFGAENVDPTTGAVPVGEVHLAWVSVSTFAVALDGHVLLLDAYIHKEEDERHYVPATTDDLIALRPEAILIGHGHFDHALEAGRIARETDATVVGTAAHCDQTAEQAGQDIACLAVIPNGAPIGTQVDFDLVDGVCTTAVLHLHSALEPPDPEHDHTNVVVPLPDVGSLLLHPPGSLFGIDGDEGGTVLYQLRVGDFTLTWHDSSGPLKENHPALFDQFRSLPRSDVQVGAILGFNQPTNGLRDPAMYIEALNPQVFVPNHHDFVFEYGSADDFEPVLQRELDTRGVTAEMRFLYDPYDYARPNLLAFDLDDPRWADPEGTPCERTTEPEAPATAAPAAASAVGDAAPAPSAPPAKGPLPTTGGVALPAIALLVAALLLVSHRRA